MNFRIFSGIDIGLYRFNFSFDLFDWCWFIRFTNKSDIRAAILVGPFKFSFFDEKKYAELVAAGEIK